MNKAKLVELAEEVLTDIDADLEEELRKELEKELCERLSQTFLHARYHQTYGYHSNEGYKKSYESVKPIIDEAINNLLDRSKKWDFGEKFTT